jgi:hypothetical protein
VDPVVEHLLRELTAGLNHLEPEAGSTERIRLLEQRLATTTAQLGIAQRELAILQQRGGGSGDVSVDPNGALDADPLAVRVDGVSVIINGSNELEAPGAAGGITELTGDVTAGPGSGSEVATLSNTGVAGGTYGNATNVGQFTVDGKGRISAATNVAITTGYPPRNACLARKSTDQTGADYTAGADVTWDTEEYDDDNWHDNSTNPERMTVPSGVSNVQVYAELRLASVTADVHVLIEFRLNGSATPAYGAQRSEVGSTNPTLSIASPVIPVTPGDFFTVFLLIETDNSVTVTADRSYLAIKKVT